LIEDEKELSDLVIDFLTAGNYLVDHAADGQEALSRLKMFPYDLVIMDWNIPGMTGPVVRTYIQRLRSKIDREGQKSMIAIVHGFGYRIDP